MSHIIAEGKTKIIHDLGDEVVEVKSKNDITAGDGAKHDIIAGKAALATQTTSNVFRLLKACDVPVAFLEQTGSETFTALKCQMIPIEVVVRRAALGSALKRAPHLEKGHVFPQLVVEHFLKTNGKQWESHMLPTDDPYMHIAPDSLRVYVYRPDQPIAGAHTLFTMSLGKLGLQIHEVRLMERVARHTFLLLEHAWATLGMGLVDFKVEFGRTADGKILLADVIDNDSWRLVDRRCGIDFSKQAYRDGHDLNEVTARYRHVAEMTRRFLPLPQSVVILWRGSSKDNMEPFMEVLSNAPGVHVRSVTCSVHKEPANAYLQLGKLTQELPHAVIIAYVGRSNGLGPVLAANTQLPVITVPASGKEMPEDVWSSLRMPSDVPILTVMEPTNAAQAALNILAQRDPRIYAHRRLCLEERLLNLTQL